MPTLDFKGKAHIYAHHLTVPYRPLVPDPARSHGQGAGGADDNLILHGDNLEALKALLPRYAGRVDCVYIDPPYNTGNEGWVYNDNVNSPIMSEWLARNGIVDGEDLERHDKWLCMMWPRLQLIRELLADDGILLVSIDENESHHLRMMLDEIFGESNFLNSFAWVSNLKGRQLGTRGAARTHETILAYAKQADLLGAAWHINNKMATKLMPYTYQMTDYDQLEDALGTYVIKNQLYNTNSRFNEETAPTMVFNIHYSPSTQSVKFTDTESSEQFPDHVLIPPKPCNDGIHKFHAWRWSRQRIDKDITNLHFKKVGDTWQIFTKVRDHSITTFKDLITNFSNGNSELKQIGLQFPSPKPSGLLSTLIDVVASPDAIVLDSFAGSGTTGHAVLALNQADGGNRKFIMVECEDYADRITAERMRRVIDGVPGAKDAALRSGLGGSFTYCTLGEPIDAEGMLTGEALPEYSDLAAHLLYTSCGVTLREPPSHSDMEPFYSDAATGIDYYLIYRPDVEWLRSNEAMLFDYMADSIARRGKAAVVFGAGKYISQRDLTHRNITFCQLPYELHRGE